MMSAFLASVIAFSTGEPINQNDEYHDAVHCRDVVHIASHNGLGVWEAVHDQSEESPGEENAIGEETEWSEPEWAVLDVVPAFNQKTGNRNGVGEVE
jgi:hypothetical protein